MRHLLDGLLVSNTLALASKMNQKLGEFFLAQITNFDADDGAPFTSHQQRGKASGLKHRVEPQGRLHSNGKAKTELFGGGQGRLLFFVRRHPQQLQALMAMRQPELLQLGGERFANWAPTCPEKNHQQVPLSGSFVPCSRINQRHGLMKAQNFSGGRMRWLTGFVRDQLGGLLGSSSLLLQGPSGCWSLIGFASFRVYGCMQRERSQCEKRVAT
jgi:hypothetical protein